MSSCRTESSADTVPVLVPVQVPLRLLEDVDGNDANARIASASLDAMYSEVELKRAERRISRKRGERMRKRKVVQSTTIKRSTLLSHLILNRQCIHRMDERKGKLGRWSTQD
eukprot:scaffold12290_cov297-Chaetoceros_neogracile.AAC.1